MRTTTTGISRDTRAAKSITSRPATSSPYTSGACRRCGGLLVDEHCMELDIGDRRGGASCWAKRCVQCGDMIDETILCNRYMPHTHPELQSDRGLEQFFETSRSV
jgi:hypothetical protein